MIGDILAVDDAAVLNGQVIVLGSGIAGAEVAVHLARHGRDVLLLESGREQFDPTIQSLNDVTFLGKHHREMDPTASYHRYLPPELRGLSRLRQFGGTSNVWTGKWKQFRPRDLEGRPWVPASAWPLDFPELLPYYRSTAADYGFGDLEVEERRLETGALGRSVTRSGLKTSSFYWEREPTRTAHRFGEEMRRSPNLRVLLGATATELRLDDSGTRVVHVVARSPEGRRITAEGQCVVLATGALETARLLLASDHQTPGGVGNSHDLVGRFYTDHLKHHSGTLRPGPLVRSHATELQYDPKPRFCVCFSLDDETQRAEELLEHALYLKPIYERRRQLLGHRFLGRPACRDDNGVVGEYRAKLATEQVPHRDSRVTLGTSLDALGQRRLHLDWRVTEQDRRSLRTTVGLLTERFREAGIGALDFGDEAPEIDTMTDAAHQMGTTRMAARAEDGVVDTDCRVFGTENLYVAGSAVFPAGPSYSPTFTILALARRLGEHLLDQTAPVPPPT